MIAVTKLWYYEVIVLILAIVGEEGRIVIAEPEVLEKVHPRRAYHFQIIQPSNLRYSYQFFLAKDFGIDFTSIFDRAELILAEPQHCCSPLLNSDQIRASSRSAVVLCNRGKSIQAEAAGADVAVVSSMSEGGDMMIEMVKDETNRFPQIPVAYLAGGSGRILRQYLQMTGERIFVRIPLNLNNTLLVDAKLPPWQLW